MTLPQFTLTNRSEFMSPAWAYSNWPVMEDQQNLADWTEAYANESTQQPLAGSTSPQDALMLQDAWPP